jgi:antitoxin HicB
MTKLYSIRLYLEPDRTGVFTVTSPDVPGLVTEGSTPAEIQANVQEALAGLMEAWRELGRDLPSALRPALADRPQTVEILVTA